MSKAVRCDPSLVLQACRASGSFSTQSQACHRGGRFEGPSHPLVLVLHSFYRT